MLNNYSRAMERAALTFFIVTCLFVLTNLTGCTNGHAAATEPPQTEPTGKLLFTDVKEYNMKRLFGIYRLENEEIVCYVNGRGGMDCQFKQGGE